MAAPCSVQHFTLNKLQRSGQRAGDQGQGVVPAGARQHAHAQATTALSSRSRGQSSTGRVCEDAFDRWCGTLSRTSLRLTQRTFTRNGPREGGYGANTRLQGCTWLRQSALGLRDAALHVSGSVNAGGMLTPNAANHNSGARPRTDSSTDGLNLSSYGDYISTLRAAKRQDVIFSVLLSGYSPDDSC
eukprot:scaffold38188_cov67-Phaeocystis_antarctica.AAC.2